MVPNEITDAITHLSSWLRSQSYHDLFPDSQIKRAIYYHKWHAIRLLAEEGQIVESTHVRVTVRCRDCCGTGRYIDDYWGGQHDHCWRCRNTGWVMLDFVQSKLPTGATWHTPLEKAPGSLLTRLSHHYILHLAPQQWTVNQPGRDMTPAEVAEAMNVVETWRWPGDEWPKQYEIRPCSWRSDRAYWEYQLPLGKRPKTCGLCGSPVEKPRVGYHVANNLLEWTDWLCWRCEIGQKLCEGPHFPDFSKESGPAGLIDHPAIQEWLERRAGWAWPQRTRFHQPCQGDDDIPF